MIWNNAEQQSEIYSVLKMKKRLPFKNSAKATKKDLKNVELSTQHTDDSGSVSENDPFPDLEQGIRRGTEICEVSTEKTVSRVQSHRQSQIESKPFRFRVSKWTLVLDCEDKEEAEKIIESFVSGFKLATLGRIELKLVIYDRLCQQNYQFKAEMERVLEAYSNYKIREIQEAQDLGESLEAPTE